MNGVLHMKIEKIQVKSALQKVKSRFPYQWSLDPYRGCQHHCEYCYALYTHAYLGNDAFFDTVYVKENILAVLENELKSAKWKHEIVAIGTVCDAYQPIEAIVQLMPQILRLFIKYQTPIIISTKSDLILRDYELIKELATLTLVNVAATITCYDEHFSQLIEKNATPSARRFMMLEQFKKTNAVVGLHLMPIIPFINDSRENIEAIFQLAKKIKVDYLIVGTLYLIGDTRVAFQKFYRQNFPAHYQEFYDVFKNYKLDPTYKAELYRWLIPLMKEYQLSSDFMPLIESKLKKQHEQLTLF